MYSRIEDMLFRTRPNLKERNIGLGSTILVIFAMVACAQFTPPEPNAVAGAIDQISYLLLDWPEGLRILIWDDIFEGGHHSHTESATNDPVFMQGGGARAVDGRAYEYSLETRDGLQAEFAIDGSPYDLEQGKLFLIRTAGGMTQVEQLNLDLSGLSPTNAGIEHFGRQTAEIARFIQPTTSVASREGCSVNYGDSKPPTETTPPAISRSLKGYVIQSYCWDGQWTFTLTVGRNALKPCDSSEPVTADNVPSYTLEGVEALKEALDHLQPGEHVTWCGSDLPDADVIDDILAFSQQSDLELSVWTGPNPSPTATALAPVLPDPTPTANQIPFAEESGFTIVEQLGGVPGAIAVDGEFVHAGFGPRVLVIDASDSTNPQLFGQSEPLPDLVRGIAVSEGVAYVAAGRAGLITLDVSDPANARILNDGPNYWTPDEETARRPWAENVTVVDDIAYLFNYGRTDASPSLLRFDIANPRKPKLLDTHDLQVSDNVLVDGDLIIVVGNRRMQLRDAANPDTILSETPLAGGSYSSRAVVTDHIVTIAETGGPGANGIEQFDLSDPTEPVALGDLVELDIFFLSSHVVTNEKVLISAGTFGEFGHCGSTIDIVGLEDGVLQLAETIDPENCITDLAIQDEKLFVTGRSGLQIFDVSDPAEPALLSQFRHPDGFHDAQSLALHDGLAYLLTGEGRGYDVVTIDVSQAAPALAGDELALGNEVFLGLYASGDMMVAPVWMGGLYTIDISDPADPQFLRMPEDGEYYVESLFTTILHGNVMYTAILDGNQDGVGVVGVIDLNDPANPILKATLESGDGQVPSLTLSGDTLYALSQGETNQIHLFDIDDPLEPQRSSAVALPEAASRLAVSGDTLFASCNGYSCQNLYSIDVTDPENPALADSWPLPFGVHEMFAGENNTIFLATYDDGIWVLNAAESDRPQLLGRLPLAGRLEISGDKIYAAANDGGLYVVQGP